MYCTASGFGIDILRIDGGCLLQVLDAPLHVTGVDSLDTSAKRIVRPPEDFMTQLGQRDDARNLWVRD